jgi:hypothetical protein
MRQRSGDKGDDWSPSSGRRTAGPYRRDSSQYCRPETEKSGHILCTQVGVDDSYQSCKRSISGKLFEEAGGVLVLFGLIGEVWAALSEPLDERLEEASSMVQTVGLAFSLASMVGANEGVSAAIATVIRAIGLHTV